MAEIKLTKNELRAQQRSLAQLQKYLPTLQLKKALLQAEVNDARLKIAACQAKLDQLIGKTQKFAALLTVHTTVDPLQVAKIAHIDRSYENIAGVEVPLLRALEFHPVTYTLFDTPAWVDALIMGLRELTEARVRLLIAQERKRALEAELRQVSIRVNLFEKVLIPRAQNNIKRVKVFLGDQELSAVGRAKVAKDKIEKKRVAEATHAH
jgi:V/A-type H+-transporting ATPase subunit D